MRLRQFDARSTAAAMQEVRAALGDDAIILASHELADGVRLTAAVEVAADDLPALLRPGVAPATQATVAACLAHHGAPAALVRALLEGLARAQAAEPAAALAHALAARFQFSALALPSSRPLALVGPPGAGKTVALVRLAAHARLAGHTAHVFTTDGDRAGGFAQLKTLLQPLQLAPTALAGPAALAGAIGGIADGSPVLIDTSGVNPFQGREVAALAELLRATRAEPVLVLPAGLDGEDSVEIAGTFAAIGARRLIVTKLDATRRLGSILAAADVGLAFAGVSLGREIGTGTTPLGAVGLARVLLHRAPPPKRPLER